MLLACSVALSGTLNTDSMEVDNFFETGFVERAREAFVFKRSPESQTSNYRNLILDELRSDGGMKSADKKLAELRSNAPEAREAGEKRSPKIFSALDKM